MDRSFYEAEIDALQKQVIAAQAVAIERGDALLRMQVELHQLKAGLTAEVAKGSGGCATTEEKLCAWIVQEARTIRENHGRAR